MIDQVIERLSQMPRQGSSYAHMGRKGWSNPIRHDTPLFLQAFAGLPGIKRILEIGTAHGESLLNMAKGNPTAEFHTIEWLPTMAVEARDNFKEAGVNATVHCGDAMQIIPALTGKFDLVFLDANKDGYRQQLELLIVHNLIAESCILIADNVIDRANDCQDFLQFMQDFSHVIIPTECGLLVGCI